MPAVSEVRARVGASMAIAVEGSEVAFPSYGAKPAVLPTLDVVRPGTRWIELFNRGDAAYTYKITADQPWVTIDAPSGSVSHTVRVNVGANWAQVSAGRSTASLRIEASTGEQITVSLPMSNVAPPKGFRGFIESDGHVAIEAPHFTRAVNQRDASWQPLPGFGRTVGAVTVFPVTAAERQPDNSAPRLEYDVYLTTTGEVQMTLDCAPSLDFQSGAGLRVAVAIDDAAPQILKLDTWNQQNWNQAVAEGIRRVTARQSVDRAGKHTVKIWMVTPGVVIERIVLNTGGLRPSYLGPPESVSLAAR
jgi:hypothetical protein